MLFHLDTLQESPYEIRFAKNTWAVFTETYLIFISVWTVTFFFQCLYISVLLPYTDVPYAP